MQVRKGHADSRVNKELSGLVILKLNETWLCDVEYTHSVGTVWI